MSRRTIPHLLSPSMAVGVLLLASVVGRFAAAQRFSVPWIAPDEMLYGLIGVSLWEDGTLAVRGTAAPYYSLLTPALIGAAMSGRDLAQGVELAQLLQLVAMSSAAIPVYLWARRLATAWWGFAAAAIAISGPALSYGGLLMTEALFYPACAWAAFALAGALERPTLERQGLFLLAATVAAAVRLQALILLPVFALAAVLFALLSPRERRFRPLAPLVVGIAGVACVGLAVQIVAPSTIRATSLLGAYAGIGDSRIAGFSLAEALVGHIAAVILVACVIPAVATALVVLGVLGRVLKHPPIQAFAATTSAFVFLLVVQVALFSAGRLDHVSQRYLMTVLPLLGVGLAAWVGVGAPRSTRALATIATIAAGVVALTAPGRLAPPTAIQDALSGAALLRLGEHEVAARVVLVALTLLGVALVAFVPRRRIAVLPLLTVAALLATSIEATNAVTRFSASEELAARGLVSQRWLDENAPGPVTLLFTGERPSTTEARTVFWNQSVREVLVLPDAQGVLPLTGRVVRLDLDTGELSGSDGDPIERQLVAAPRSTALEGEELAAMQDLGATSPGLVLWRANAPLRVAWRVTGLLPNGDLSGQARVIVPACRSGALQLTVLGKSGDPVGVLVNGVRAPSIDVAAEDTGSASIPTPGYVDGSRPCEFVLETEGYVGLTRVAFVRNA